MSDITLPKEWRATQLGDVVEYGKTQKCELSDIKVDTWILELEDIEKNSSRIIKRLNTSERPFKSTKNKFKEGDILYGKLRPYLNKVVIADDNGVCSTEIIPLNAEPNVNNHYLFHWLRSEAFLNYVVEVSYGVNMPRLGTKDGLLAPFILPPLAEQKVIADKLDILLAQVETIKARLDRIPKILKTFRQSVLAAAVSGKLTEEWRKDKRLNVSNELKQIHKSRDEFYQKDNKKHFDKTGKNLRKYDYSTLNEEPVVRAIPEGWELVKLGEIVSFLTDYHANGSYEVLKEHVELKETEDYACMIRATNFEKNNFYDLFVYISEEAYEFLEKSKLYGNEILIGKIGNAGSVYLMPKLDKPASLAMNLFALRFDEKLVNPNYIYMFLNSSLGEANIQKYVRGVATKSIDKKSVRSVFINYPSFEEQTQIVRRVEELFAFADRIEQKANAALERVNNLIQSILAKAFRGELTADWRAQNPDLISGDNSAEALLEKIKAEREALSSKKKPKKKTAARKKA